MAQDANRLTKINFNERTVEASENLVTKKQKENAQDLRYENRRKVKKKLQTLGLSCFIGKSYFDDDGSHNQ